MGSTFFDGQSAVERDSGSGSKRFKGVFSSSVYDNAEETVKNIIMRFSRHFSLQFWMFLFRYKIYLKLGTETFLSYDVTLNNGTTRLKIPSVKFF